MRRRYLSEPAAWREVARKIAEGEWGGGGMCHVVVWLFHHGHIDSATQLAMSARTRGHRDVYGRGANPHWPYAFPPSEPDVRVLAALFLSLEAESEGA